MLLFHGEFLFLICFYAVIVRKLVNADSLLIKCCQLNEVYDIDNRECVVISSHDNNDESLFHNEPSIGFPECTDDQVAIEYDSEKYNITIDGDILRLPSHVKPTAMIEMNLMSFCIDYVSHKGSSAKKHWMAKTCQSKSVCNSIPCVKKCCGDGKRMKSQNENAECVYHKPGIKPVFHNVSENGISETEAKVYGILHHQKCGKYHLDENESSDKYYLDIKNGNLRRVDHRSTEPFVHIMVHTDYCVDLTENGKDSEKYSMFLCIPEIEPKLEGVDTNQYLKNYKICLTISIVFLFATLLIYLLITTLPSIPERALILYFACLFIAHTALLIHSFYLEGIHAACGFVGVSQYIGFLCGLTWLNVMFFDIWRTFRMKTTCTLTNQKYKFLFYSTYAWGVPLLLLAFCVLNDQFYVSWHQYMYSCWFYDSVMGLLFFYLPAWLFMVVSSVFCVLTIINLKRITRNVNRQNNSQDTRLITQNAQISMHIKLIILMLAPWLSEALFIFFPVSMWETFDFISALQGMFIFIVFVLNRKTMVALKIRLGFAQQADSTNSFSSDIGGLAMDSSAHKSSVGDQSSDIFVL